MGTFPFWLGVSFIHRLVTIMNPPLEAAHNWRQTTVCMVARNFYEIDANIFYPRLDMPGDLTGITGMEFPLLNYIIYLVSLLFGYDHWYGRLINLVVTSLGLVALERFLRDLVGSRIAFVTSMLVLFSLFYYYARKVMPDTFSMALVMIGIYQWHRFTRKRNWTSFLVGTVCIGFGVLSKLPAVVMLAFFWPVFWRAEGRQKGMFVASLGLVALTSAWWYFHWVPYLQDQFGFQHFFMGSSVSEAVGFLSEHWQETLHMYYQRAIGYSGFVFFLVGAVFLIRNGRAAWGIALSSLPLLVLLLLKSGNQFIDHEYYILPFIPFMAFVAAFALERIPKSWLIGLLLIYAAEGITRKWEDQSLGRVPEIANLEEAISGHVPDAARIVLNSPAYPTPLYFTHRRGWLASNEQLLQPEFMADLKQRGCSYALILKKRFGTAVELPYAKVLDDELLTLYRLE